MACQLVYTSTSRGLAASRSGFCTVARPKDMRDLLVTALEQISSYHHLRTGENSNELNPVISTFRILDLRGSRYYVLSKIRDCGLDYTNRTNHIAHHLIFQENEIATAPSPAWILRHWTGWLPNWQGDARFLGPEDEITSFPHPTGRDARNWNHLTGDPSKAALPISGHHAQNCSFIISDGQEETLLDYFHESLQILLPASGSSTALWQFPFTTFIQVSDAASDFRWKGAWPSHAATLQAPILDLTQPATLPEPDPILAKAAREQTPPPVTAVVLSLPPAPLPPTTAPEPEPQAKQPLSSHSHITININSSKASLPALKPGAQPPKPLSAVARKKSLVAREETKSSSTLWMAFAALIVIGGLIGYLVSMSFSKSSPENTAVIAPTRPLPKPDTNPFPSVLPAITNVTVTPTNIEPKVETNIPPPKIELPPPPPPVIANFDGLENGLPKRPTYFVIGSLKGGGVEVRDPSLSETLSTLLGKTSELRALRLSGAPNLASIPTEIWAQHYPGTTEITRGKIFSPTLEEILTYRTQNSVLNLKSPTCGQVLLLPGTPDADSFQLLITELPSLQNTPLLKLSRSWLEDTTTPDASHIASIAPDKWKNLLDKIRPTATGNWSLHSAGDLTNLTATTNAPTTSSPTLTIGLTPAETAQIDDIKKNLTQIKESSQKFASIIQAREALYSPPFNNFGALFFATDETALTKSIAEMEKAVNDTTKGQKERAPARILLEKYKPRLELLTFESYQKSQSHTKEDTMPKDYVEYVRKVLESRESDIVRGVFINQKSEPFLPREPSLKNPVDFMAAKGEFSTTLSLTTANQTTALTVSQKVWDDTFTKNNLDLISPFMSSQEILKLSLRNEITTFFGPAVSKGNLQDLETKLDSLEKRQNLFKQGLKSAGDIFLIWESGGEFTRIAIFSEN